MLTIFNRTAVYSSYSLENIDKIKDILDKENVAYLTRTTKSEIGFDELGEAFQLYVHRDDVEEAQRLIHEVLFTEIK